MAELMCLYAELAAHFEAEEGGEVSVIIGGWDVSYDGTAYHWIRASAAEDA